MRKFLSLLLSAALVLSMVPAMALTGFAADSTVEGVVTEMDVKGNTIYVYAPKSELPVASATTAPCFMVFGDKPYTAKTAESEALSSGLAKIAAKEGATVVFINPQGNTWGEADKDVYVSMIDMYSNSTDGTDFVNGIAKSVNFMTKQEETKIMGANEARIYLYAEGAGADFVAANYMKAVKLSMTFPDGFSMEFDRTATTITLFNPTALPTAEGPASLAVAVVNGPADTAEKLAGLTGKALVSTSSVKDGFDAKWIGDNYSSFSGAFRSQAGRILPMHDYAKEGIVESMERMESDQLRNGATTLDYIVYYDKNLDVHDSANPVPLVLAFHGGGNSALFEAQATEWPEIAQAHGFIAVCVDLHHPNSTAEQTIELIDHLKETYAIDASRIYASGFSMGSVKSWDLFEQYATVFAGLAPMDATEAPGTDSFGKVWDTYNTDVPVPLFFVGGQTSPLPEMPCQAEKVVQRVDYAFSVNDVVQDYSYNDSVNHWWGVNGDVVYQVTDKVAFTDSTLTVNLFQSADGKFYTALADASNQSHEVYARNSWAAWDFLSQFSRKADGSIAIEKVDYSLASDDGKVTDNGYNTFTSYYYDVNVYTSHAEAINAVTEAGLMVGVDRNYFEPNGTVTRAMVATVLYRMADSPDVEITVPFADVAKGAWYADSIGWAYAKEIMIGKTDGLAHPYDLITSSDLDLMLSRYARSVGAEYTSSGSAANTIVRSELAYRLANLLDTIAKTN